MKKQLLDKHLYALEKTKKIQIPIEAKEFILRAMDEYVDFYFMEWGKVSRFKKPRFLLSAGTFFTQIGWVSLVLRLREISFFWHKNMAIRRSKIENRKLYVIRSGELSYILLSTSDIDLNKKLRVFGKFVDAKTLHQTADFVALPKNRH